MQEKSETGIKAAVAVDEATLERLRADVGDLAFRRLTGFFVTEAQALLEALERAVVAKELLESARLGHSLKSAAASFGLGGIAQVAREIETLGEARKLEGVKQALARLRLDLPEALNALAVRCRQFP